MWVTSFKINCTLCSGPWDKTLQRPTYRINAGVSSGYETKPRANRKRTDSSENWNHDKEIKAEICMYVLNARK